ncbi:hypothetical protein J6590_008887, partial [Homalodisca vitripennis]
MGGLFSSTSVASKDTVLRHYRSSRLPVSAPAKGFLGFTVFCGRTWSARTYLQTRKFFMKLPFFIENTEFDDSACHHRFGC